MISVRFSLYILPDLINIYDTFMFHSLGSKEREVRVNREVKDVGQLDCKTLVGL